jgi:hypothetical protein
MTRLYQISAAAQVILGTSVFDLKLVAGGTTSSVDTTFFNHGSKVEGSKWTRADMSSNGDMIVTGMIKHHSFSRLISYSMM